MGGNSFWLLVGDLPAGPFTVEQVHAKVAAGEADWQTPACRVGSGRWLPLVRTPGLGPQATPESPAAGGTTDTSPPAPPPPGPAGSPTGAAQGGPADGRPLAPSLASGPGCGRPDGFADADTAFPDPADANPVTTDRLSGMGNLICIYCLVLNPLLWAVDNLACCLTGSSLAPQSQFSGFEVLVQLLHSALGLGTAALLAWGGARLRKRGLAGKGLAQAGFAVSLAVSAVCFLSGLLLAVAAMAREDRPFAESTPEGTVISFFTTVLDLCAWAFEVVALVWLARSGPGPGPAAPGRPGAPAPSAPTGDPAPLVPAGPSDGPRVWAHGVFTPSVVVLAGDHLVVGSAPRSGVPRVEAAARHGHPVRRLLNRGATQVPLGAVVRVESVLEMRAGRRRASLAVTWRQVPAGGWGAGEQVTAVPCAGPAEHDEILALLRGRLGPGWRPRVTTDGHLRVVVKALCVAAGVAVCTAALYAESQSPRPATGDGGSRGRYRVASDLARVVGPAPVLALGVLTLGFVVFEAVQDLADPPRRLTLTPPPPPEEPPG
jgi:hypothetical protein